MTPATDETSPSVLHPLAADAGKRLDAFVAEQVEGWSRSRLQRLIEGGDILVNQKEVKSSYKLREGDEIDVDLTEVPVAKFEPENIPLDIVFEDEYLAVINKPAGMVVHPGAGIQNGTLANAIAWHFKSHVLPYEGGSQSRSSTPSAEAAATPPIQEGSLGERSTTPSAEAAATPPIQEGSQDRSEAGVQSANRVGIVHRLDKDTSGLIVVAKDEETHEALADLFQKREVFKSYVSLVHGSPRENSGTIDRPLARDRWHRTKMTVAANGRHALSIWKVRQRFEKFTLVEVEIKTGRTHQIRVHLASINHPVVGDATYNEGRDNTVSDVDIKNSIRILNRFFLHAEKLSFAHPKTGEAINFVAPLPIELTDFLAKIK